MCGHSVIKQPAYNSKNPLTHFFISFRMSRFRFSLCSHQRGEKVLPFKHRHSPEWEAAVRLRHYWLLAVAAGDIQYQQQRGVSSVVFWDGLTNIGVSKDFFHLSRWGQWLNQQHNLLDLAGLHFTTSERSGPFWQSMLHNFLSRPLSFLGWTTAMFFWLDFHQTQSNLYKWFRMQRHDWSSTSPKEPMLHLSLSPCTGYQLQLASSSRHWYLHIKQPSKYTHTWSRGHCSLRRSSSTTTACNFIHD